MSKPLDWPRYMIVKRLEEGTKYRSANLAIDIAKKAWRVVQRRYPDLFHPANPFEGLERIHCKREIAQVQADLTTPAWLLAASNGAGFSVGSPC
jgi:hypothetical protein